MKDSVSSALLSDLAAVRGEPCVSLYLPTHFAGPEVRQDEPRLDALLDSAREQLTARGLRSTVARDLVAAARNRAIHPKFWHGRSQGLALFFSPAFERQLHTPGPVTEQVNVGVEFLLRPLLPFALASDRFFLLAVVQRSPHLWRGTEFGLTEVTVPGMPEGIDDVLHEVAHQGSLRNTTGSSEPVYHGQGSRRDAHKTDLDRYLREVQTAVAAVLHDEQAPLVLAGVAPTVDAFRRLLHYPFVVTETVLGSVNALSLHQLHEQAWKAVLPALTAPRTRALARRAELAGTTFVTDQPAELLRAAHEGRVESLFVPASIQLSGRFDDALGTVDLSLHPRPGDVDLINLMLLETLRHSGAVYDAQDACALSAVLRY